MAIPRTQTAIFFDNDPTHIAEVNANCPNIQCVQIDMSIPPIPRVTMRSILGVDKIAGLHGNPYYAFILSIQRAQDSYDSFSGIQPHHIVHFFGRTGTGLIADAPSAGGAAATAATATSATNANNATGNARHTKRAAAEPNIENGAVRSIPRLPPVSETPHIQTIILDWDRTLTLFEGVVMRTTTFRDNGYLRGLDASMKAQYAIDNPGLVCPDTFVGGMEPIMPEDMLIYLFGGRDRLEIIRSWLYRMNREGKKIVILTNNSVARNTEPFRNGFLQLLSAFLPKLRGQYRTINHPTPPEPLVADYTIICSADYGNNKALALRTNVSGVCDFAPTSSAGGGGRAGGAGGRKPRKPRKSRATRRISRK